MRLLSFSLARLNEMLIKSGGSRYNCTQEMEIPKILYISHDGDEADKKSLMKSVVLKEGFLPMHPEAALDMYMVTNNYNGNKKEIIKDCLSLINACDDFSVMSPQEIKDEDGLTDFLPEGVISESIYWGIRRNKPIKIFNMGRENNYQDLLSTPGYTNLSLSAGIFDKLHHKKMGGVADLLNTSDNLRPTVCALFDEKLIKYKNWVRQSIYGQNKVPLCPYDQADFSDLMMAGWKNAIDNDRVKIAFSSKCDEIQIFGEKIEPEINESNPGLLFVLFHVIKNRPDIKIYYRSLAEIGVPKYAKTLEWSFTEKEKNEVISSQQSAQTASSSVPKGVHHSYATAGSKPLTGEALKQSAPTDEDICKNTI